MSPESGSVADSCPTAVPIAWFSRTVEGESAMFVGGLFSTTSVIAIVNAFSNARPRRSVARIRTEYELLVSKSKTAFVFSVAPVIWKEALSAPPAPGTSANVWLSPESWSLADSVPTVVPAGWFSATLVFESAMSVGAWSTTTKAVSVAPHSAGSPARRRLPFGVSAQK